MFIFNYMISKKKDNTFLSNIDLIKQISFLIVNYLWKYKIAIVQTI